MRVVPEAERTPPPTASPLRWRGAPGDIATIGVFSAIAAAMRTVADPGDQMIYSLSPWFLCVRLAAEAGLVPVRVRISLAATDAMIERGLPGFAAAIAGTGACAPEAPVRS